MVNQSKKNDQRFWNKWKKSGAIGNADGRDYGEAYAFFDCNAPLLDIARESEKIKRLINPSKKLTLVLAEGHLPLMTNLFHGTKRRDLDLFRIALDASDAGMRYTWGALLPANRTNKDAADELSLVLSQAYQSPLYQKGEEFRGGICYKENGEYFFRD